MLRKRKFQVIPLKCCGQQVPRTALVNCLLWHEPSIRLGVVPTLRFGFQAGSESRTLHAAVLSVHGTHVPDLSAGEAVAGAGTPTPNSNLQ